MGTKTTARQVAEAAGVSVATVDRVLNARGGVSPDKEKRVLHWARQLHMDRSLAHRPARTLRISVILQGPQNPFHMASQQAFQRIASHYLHFNMQLAFSHADPNDHQSCARLIDRLGQRHDGLIVTYPSSDIIVAAIDRQAARVPVITFATDIPTSRRHVYIGPDDEQAGRIAGDLMGRLLSGKGEILIIAGLLRMTGQMARQTGFRSVIETRYPQCRIAQVAESHESQEKAGRLVHAALTRHPGIRGIYNASTGAQAIADALSANGCSRDVVFITHELTPDRRRLIEAGLLDAIIDQDVEHEARIAIETMARLVGRLEGEAASVLTPTHIHMIENI